MAEDNLVGLDIFVELGERFARAGRALEAGIAEIHVLEFFKEVLHALACEIEELFDRHRQHAAAAEIVLVFLAVTSRVQPVLQRKVINSHHFSPYKLMV